ncbi:hypothetical protein OZX67_00810 [Bifidobacterium sp. ESL0728]|uniref:hypothetical protein n=1 Tax=Bifidobacterium sp. ESL0728 TaxID=2983220 RepID=UPI0023FA211A|nr:hypothetical protein [Bifidobacterium sp. ESL0728]WEV59148.1 hypothetical protein OZX67_00810 [Bifidobacterium sp. ESL0728]
MPYSDTIRSRIAALDRKASELNADHRDFTDRTKQQFLQWAKEVEPKNAWQQFWDPIENGYIANELSQQETVAAQTGTELAAGYERDVIDMNDMSVQQINKIWQKVNDDANEALSKFVATRSDLEGFQQQLDALADTMSGGTGSGTLDIDYINGGLSASVASFNKLDAIYKDIEGMGLTEAEASQSPDVMAEVLKRMGNNILQLEPELAANGTFEVGLGPGLVMTLSLSTESDHRSGLKITVPDSIIKGQRTELKDLISFDPEGLVVGADGQPVDNPYLKDQGYGDWENEPPIPAKNGDITYKSTRKHGDKTQRYSETINLAKPSLAMSVGVSQPVNGGTVSTDIGLKTTMNDWHPFRKPDPVKDPVRVPVPNLPDWHREPVREPVPGRSPVPLLPYPIPPVIPAF